MPKTLKYSSNKERLDVLNKDASNTLIIDVIDRPIRPLILEMNRIGLNTRFSCCGFSYRDEEEPKSHSEWPFILFKFNDQHIDECPQAVKNFMIFAKWASHTGWTFRMEHPAEGEWGIVLHTQNDCGWKSSDNLKPIHEPERKITAIQNLTNVLTELPSVFDGVFELTDGNNERLERNPEWLVIPKRDCFVMTEKTDRGYRYTSIPLAEQDYS